MEQKIKLEVIRGERQRIEGVTIWSGHIPVEKIIGIDEFQESWVKKFFFAGSMHFLSFNLTADTVILYKGTVVASDFPEEK